MITYYYTALTGSQVTIAFPLIDSDRYWPERLDFDGAGVHQQVHPIDAPNATLIARGGVLVDLTIPARRGHANTLIATQYVGIEINKPQGTIGNLVIDFPGGGRVQMRGCGLVRATGYNVGVHTYCQFVFRGPRPIP